MSFCASISGAQTITGRVIELADSADFYMKHSRWEDAERTIITALRHEPANPSNWLMWSNLGVVRTHLQNYNGALEAYEIGLTGAPRSTVLLSNRAWTRLINDDPDGAMRDLDSTLEIDSLQPWPLKMHGLLSLSKGDYKRAITDLMASDSLKNRDADVLSAIGTSQAALGNNSEAIRYYGLSFEIEENPDVLFRQLLLMTSDDSLIPAAERRTAEALEKWPATGEFHLVRALLLKKKFQNDAVEHEKKLAIKYGVSPALIDSILNER